MAANAEQIDESLKRQALAEEEAAMNQYKKSTNPFLSSPTAAQASGPSIAGGFNLKSNYFRIAVSDVLSKRRQ